MKYSAWLALSVPTVTDVRSAEKAKKALLEIKGVGQVQAYPKQRVVAVSFKGEKEVATGVLFKSLFNSGLEARTY